VPLSSTVEMNHLQGPSYIYAILMDSRIRRDDWWVEANLPRVTSPDPKTE
jgi:hypothetical protein